MREERLEREEEARWKYFLDNSPKRERGREGKFRIRVGLVQTSERHI